MKLSSPESKTSWGTSQAIILSGVLFLIGLGVQLLMGSQSEVIIPGWPVNLMILGGLILLLAVVALLTRKFEIFRWLSSVPVCICSILFLLALGITAGVLTQDGSIWYRSMTSSWPFAFALGFWLLVLGMTFFKRLWPLQIKNLGFLLNHGGLWILTAAMVFGSGDLFRLRLFAQKGEITEVAYDAQSENFESPLNLPFGIELQDFQLELYPPKIGIFNSDTGESLLPLSAKLLEAVEGTIGMLGHWETEVLQVHHSQSAEDPDWVRVRAINKKTEQIRDGRLRLSTKTEDAEVLDIPKGMMALLEPQAKLYRSQIVLHTDDGKTLGASIEVNHPLKVGAWQIFQSSYDEENGKYSTMSVFDLVYDPWIYAVYTGMVLVLLGMIALFFDGIRRREIPAEAIITPGREVTKNIIITGGRKK